MKAASSKHRKVHEMASEYHFDYKKAKSNRFAEKMNLNVGWTVEKFVAEEKKEGKKKEVARKAKAPAKAKPAKKTSSEKGKKKK